jgi:N-acetylglucosaminyl-diphospho-decaprenol L-rhamnosyltransferase
MTPLLSIVIVTYNSSRQIDACLHAAATTLPPLDYETVVVDNASPDGTASIVRHRWPAVHVIDAAGNVGFSRATNIGIRQSSGAFLLALNPDTVLHRGAVRRLLDTLELRPDVAVVGPRLVDGRGRAELSFGSMIGPFSELRQKLLVRGNDRGAPIIGGYVQRLTRRPRAVDWVSGACLLVRRSDAEAVGLFDERYFMYAEDVDFCAAIRARGRKVLFVPEAEVSHLRGQSVASLPRATEVAYRRSQLAFYAKHHPGWLPLLRAYLTLSNRLPPD